MSQTAHRILTLAALVAAGLSVTGPVRADDPPAPVVPAVAAPVDLQNAVCPVKGKPVTAGITATVDGTIVHFCCTMCAAKYRASPATYAAALRADPAVAQRMDNALAAQEAPAVAAAHVSPNDVKGLAFRDEMRKLWRDHVLWTRLFVVSAMADLPDADAARTRLLRNQDDIGAALKPLYGDDAGAKLTTLLKDHVAAVAELAAATKADPANVDAPTKKAYANADAIATFLSASNPTAWSQDAVKSMMHDHLDLTVTEIKARLAKDWDADVEAYEKIEAQALKMADMLSSGMRSQFPQKFN